MIFVPSQAKPSQAKPSQAKPSQVKSSQVKSSQAKSSRAKSVPYCCTLFGWWRRCTSRCSSGSCTCRPWSPRCTSTPSDGSNHCIGKCLDPSRSVMICGSVYNNNDDDFEATTLKMISFFNYLWNGLPLNWCSRSQDIERAVVVERSLPTPEVRGSNPVISKN